MIIITQVITEVTSGSDLAVRMMLAFFFRPVQSPSPSDYIHALPNKPTDVLC